MNTKDFPPTVPRARGRLRVRVPVIAGCSALALATLVILVPLPIGGNELLTAMDHTATPIPSSAAILHPTPLPTSTSAPSASSAPVAPAPPSASDDGGAGAGSVDTSEGTPADPPPADDTPVIITLPPVHIDPPYAPPYTDADAQAAVVNAYGAIPVYGNCYPANSGTWGRTSSPPAPDWGGTLGYEAGASESGDGGWVRYFSCD